MKVGEVIGVLAVGAAILLAGCQNAPPAALPETLEGTGLHSVEISPFTPQYPLWSDGATKRRWIHLPKGSTIDASNPDAWQFPVGTKLWKEFWSGRAIETRFMERTATGWRFATYEWSPDGRTATLAPERGTHQVPSRGDCRVCHGNGSTPVLGFSRLQLSTDRDPNAVHREPLPHGAIDLGTLVESGRLRGWSGSTATRIAARTTTERAALGYLHANCGTCHRGDGALASLGMILASSSTNGAPGPIETTVDRPSRAAPGHLRIAHRDADRSLLLERMRSRNPFTQMPPLGTQLVDDDGVRVVERWIEELPNGS